MKDQELLARITVDSKVMGGKPVIRGTRLVVEYILNLLAHGARAKDILTEYKGLTQEETQTCILSLSLEKHKALQKRGVKR